MRLIGGYLKGKRLAVPKNFPSRPTTDFAKEGLFNILNNLVEIEEMNVLDLCAGTGNISFEFVSRGAPLVFSVDSNAKCIRHIEQTARELSISNSCKTYKSDCIVFCKNSNISFDLIFADPPFYLNIHHELIDSIFQGNILNKNGKFILEHGKNLQFDSHNEFSFSRNFGNVVFSFFNFKND